MIRSLMADNISMSEAANNTPSKSAGAKPGTGLAGIARALENLPVDIETVTDPMVRRAFVILFNLVERASAEIAALREEIQRLRDENNRLKGEQGKPDIRPGRKKDGDISSEKERRSREKSGGKKRRGSKLDKIEVHRTRVRRVDPERLPGDAVFKGYESVVVQDLKITPENIEFKKEIYYSPSRRKTYRASLPAGYDGEFGPGIRSVVLLMKYVCNMSEPKVLEFLQEHDVVISAATISRMLTKNLAVFHREKADLYAAGLESSTYQQIDDTSARVNGRNHHTQIVCNDLYAAYFTTERKDRLTILDVLRQFESRVFLFNDETARLLESLRVPQYLRNKLREAPQGVPLITRTLNEEEMDAILDGLFPDPGKGRVSRIRIKEAAAIAAYHQETGVPVVKVLVCDDAPQFKLLTEELMLCWVHEGRHYKRLRPVVPYHRERLETFRGRYWDFYAELLAFKKDPSERMAQALSEGFDDLFSTKTCYEDLDGRIARSRAKKEELLTVLRHPEAPLHNNACENEARVAARRRDVSLHTRTKEGTQACDTMTSIVRTAGKLGVSAFKYIADRISGAFRLSSLADLIRARTAHLNSANGCRGP